MLCARLLRRSHSLSNQKGSGVTGFVLVAPLLCLVLVMGFTLGGVVICKASMQANLRQAARWAALYDSNPSAVRDNAQQFWLPIGFATCGSDLQIAHNNIGVTKFVTLRVNQCLELPIFQKVVSITVTQSEVDERAI